jgi:hypothetical protein
MKVLRTLTVAAMLHLLVGGSVALAQVDPTTTTASDTASTATADPNQEPTTDTTDTSSTATDTTATTATTSTTPLGEGNVSWLHHTFELETLAWMLPLVAFILSILIGAAVHAGIVQHDVRGWPNTSGSWWKLRFLPLLLGVGLVITSYFLVVRGLDEELLRVAEPRAKLWAAIYLVLLLVFWLLPKPKAPPSRGRATQESA